MSDYPTYNPRRAAAIAALLVDPSEKRPYNGPKFSLPVQGGDSYTGPRFDPAAVSRGSYTGPKFSVSHTDADAQDDAYAGPKFVVNRTERPADADRVTDEPRQYPVFAPQAEPQQYPVWRTPVSQTEPQVYPKGPTFDLTAARAALGQAPGGSATGAGPLRARDSTTPAPSQYEQDLAHYRDLLMNPPENTNSRAAGALRLAAFGAGNAAQTGSLGRAAGAGLAGFISGLINKRADEQIIDRPRELARAQTQLGVDAAADKETLARREAEARIDEQNALAEMHRRPPRPPKPQYIRDGRGRIFVVDSENPSQAQAVTDESGKI